MKIRLLPELSGDNSKKPITKAHVWLRSPHRRTYQEHRLQSQEFLATMTGISIFGRGLRSNPVKGGCSLFWDHVKVIICGGKEAPYIYVRKWLAHLIQKPWIIATALVLRGKQGTGKGTFVRSYRQAAWPSLRAAVKSGSNSWKIQFASKKCDFDFRRRSDLGRQ